MLWFLHTAAKHSVGVDRERAQNEISILRRCRHPHIVRLYHMFETSTELFLIMEWYAVMPLYSYHLESVVLFELSAQVS